MCKTHREGDKNKRKDNPYKILQKYITRQFVQPDMSYKAKHVVYLSIKFLLSKSESHEKLKFIQECSNLFFGL